MAVLWKVEDEAEAVLRERRTFRHCVESLAGSASDPEVDAAELIYGELVANAVRHARGAVEARLELVNSHPPVLVVRDHGPGLGPKTEAHGDPFAESGRGLRIVEVLARELDVDAAEGGGTVVRATLPVKPRRELSSVC